MHVSFNQIIRMTRGDTENINLTSLLENAKEIVDNATEYDTFYMAIMEPGQLFEEAMIKKRVSFVDILDKHAIVFHLASEDTEFLHPGKYYYTIKKGNTATDEVQVFTLIPNTIFWVE